MSAGNRILNCDLHDRLPGERGTLALARAHTSSTLGHDTVDVQDPEYRAIGQCAWMNPSTRQLVIPPQEAFDRLRASAPAAVISSVKPRESHKWHDRSTTPALEYTITVGDHSISLIRPEPTLTRNLNLPENDQIAEAIRAIPAYQRRATATIVVNHVPHPASANNATIEADAGAGAIDYYPFRRPPDQWTVDTRTMHEFGHNFHNTVWRSRENVGRWALARNLDVISPSRYAGSDIQEDFCEFLIIYNFATATLCEQSMRKLYPNRCWLMDRYRRE